MKYIFTNHAKQRRPHHTPRTENELIEIMQQFNTQLNFSTLEDGKYKIARKGAAAILFKKSDVITVITIRGFKNQDDTKFDEAWHFRKITEEEDKQKAIRRKAREAKKKWMQKYPAVFKETSNNEYSVFFPDLSGCISSGKGFEEAITMAKKALSLHLSEMLNSGHSKPAVNLQKSKEIAKGNILLMIEPEKNSFVVRSEIFKLGQGEPEHKQQHYEYPEDRMFNLPRLTNYHVAYTRQELIDYNIIAENIDEMIDKLASGSLEKIAIIRDDKIETVMLSESEYKRMQINLDLIRELNDQA